MKICFIITGLSAGGAEMMLYKLLSKIDRQRFSPYVISLTTLGEIGPRILSMGIPVEPLGMGRGISACASLWRLWRILQREQPAIVQTWLYHADLLGGMTARLAGRSPVIWAIRNSNLDKDKTRWTTRLVVTISAALSGCLPQNILYCSERSRQIHERLGYCSHKTHVIPNGFDLSCFKPDEDAKVRIKSALGLSAQTPLVGLIARFDPQKNHLGFLQAVRTVHQRLPEVHFVLAGQDVDTNNAVLTKPLARWGLTNHVHLLGLRHDIPAIMAALNIHALPSYGEAFPNVLGEAMACGVPCVATDVGDCAFIIGDTGRIVAAGDMSGLATAIEAILTLPAQEQAALGKKARARIAEHFELGVIVRQYEDFYEKIVREVGTR